MQKKLFFTLLIAAALTGCGGGASTAEFKGLPQSLAVTE